MTRLIRWSGDVEISIDDLVANAGEIRHPFQISRCETEHDGHAEIAPVIIASGFATWLALTGLRRLFRG